MIDKWLQAPDAPSGMELVASIVADTVEAFGLARAVGVPAEHVENPVASLKVLPDEKYLGTVWCMSSRDAFAELPSLFSSSDALERGLSPRALRDLEELGHIERIARGLFAASDMHADLDLAEVAFRSDRATLCLTSALVHYGLTDEIPTVIDVAMPRGHRLPKVSAPVAWHKFDAGTFDVGRGVLDIGAGYVIGLYSAERSICDAFRLRHQEGSELAIEALKRWLRWPKAQPAKLLACAAEFGPKALTPIRSTLQVLL